jgi:hypothetical protein
MLSYPHSCFAQPLNGKIVPSGFSPCFRPYGTATQNPRQIKILSLSNQPPKPPFPQAKSPHRLCCRRFGPLYVLRHVAPTHHWRNRIAASRSTALDPAIFPRASEPAPAQARGHRIPANRHHRSAGTSLGLSASDFPLPDFLILWSPPPDILIL